MYLRVSLDATGERLAVDRQREDCRAIIDGRGWTLTEEYVDNSVSASDRRKRRPAYDRMVSDYAAGRFDALVCWDLDRLTRQPRQLEDWIDAAEERGLRLVTANGEADLSTDGGRLFARIKASVARSEVDRKAERQRRAAQQRADHGKPPGGVRLTGYTTGGDVIEREALIVRSMFDRFTRGESLRGIVRILDEAGVTTRSGRQWNPSTVQTALRNPRYAGLAVYRGALTGKVGNWPPLVSEDVWRLAQARLDDPRRKTNKVGTERRHLGSGLWLCGECGRPVTAWSGNRYRCAPCGLTRTAEPVDDLVLSVIRARLSLPDAAGLVAPPDTGEGARLNERARDLRARLSAIGDDYDAGRIDGTRYASARARVEAELAQVDRERVAVAGMTAAASTLTAGDPVAAFDGETLMVRRQVIDALCTVRLHRGTHGSRTFDPETVRIEWRTA